MGGPAFIAGGVIGLAGDLAVRLSGLWEWRNDQQLLIVAAIILWILCMVIVLLGLVGFYYQRAIGTIRSRRIALVVGAAGCVASSLNSLVELVVHLSPDSSQQSSWLAWVFANRLLYGVWAYAYVLGMIPICMILLLPGKQPKWSRGLLIIMASWVTLLIYAYVAPPSFDPDWTDTALFAATLIQFAFFILLGMTLLLTERHAMPEVGKEVAVKRSYDFPRWMWLLAMGIIVLFILAANANLDAPGPPGTRGLGLFIVGGVLVWVAAILYLVVDAIVNRSRKPPK